MPAQLEFDEDGMKSITEFGRTEHKWSYFIRFGVNNKILLLYATPRFAIMVPRKGIGSNDDWKGLLDLVRRKIAVGSEA